MEHNPRREASGALLSQVKVGYGKKIIIDDVNLEICPGKILTLIGPNGSGKSTVLKTILKALPRISGSIAIAGKDLDELSGNELARSISMVMTERLTTELMTCRDIVATGRYPYTGHFGILSKEDEEKVAEAIAMVHAEDVADADFQKISDGQRQRILLARAICQDTEIIVLDEPTSYLDLRYKIDLLKNIHRLAKEQNKAIVMSLHELDLARLISDEIACVGEHRIVKLASPDEIYQGSFLQELFGVDAEEFDPATGMVRLKL